MENLLAFLEVVDLLINFIKNLPSVGFGERVEVR